MTKPKIFLIFLGLFVLSAAAPPSVVIVNPPTEKITEALERSVDVDDEPLNAKWVWWNNPNHYLSNEKGSDVWKEFTTGDRLLFTYKLVALRDDGTVVLYDRSRKTYAWLTNDRIYFSRSQRGLASSRLTAPGKWEIKPAIRVVEISFIRAKWVWASNPNHFLINQFGSQIWFEVVNGRVVYEYYFIGSDRSNDPVLYDPLKSLYVLPTDTTIYFSRRIDRLRDSDNKQAGRWEINFARNPPIRVVSVVNTDAETLSFNRKWVWDENNRHFIEPQIGIDVWIEVENGRVLNQYYLIGVSNGYPVLYNWVRNVFAKITPRMIYFGSSLWNIDRSNQKAPGRWVNIVNKQSSTDIIDVIDVDNNNDDVVIDLKVKRPEQSSSSELVPVPRQIVRATWRWKSNPNHFIRSTFPSDVWVEVLNRQVLSEYVLVALHDGDLVLYDPYRRVFSKITENMIFFSRDLWGLDSTPYKAEGSWTFDYSQKRSFINPKNREGIVILEPKSDTRGTH